MQAEATACSSDRVRVAIACTALTASASRAAGAWIVIVPIWPSVDWASLDVSVSVTSVQEFDPTSNGFPRSFQLLTARASHGAILLPDGNVAVFGGATSAQATAPLDTIELVHQ